MEGRYINTIHNTKTKFPYRFKTEEEFKSEIGDEWRRNVGWTSNPNSAMDRLFGKDFIAINNIDEIFSNPRIVYQDKNYIRYHVNGSDWDICREMLIENVDTLLFKGMYKNQRQNIYESNKNDYLSIDIFYRIKSIDDREDVLKVLEDNGINTEKLHMGSKVVVISFYMNKIPDYADSNKDVTVYHHNLTDAELIDYNMEYNNGDYYFANNIKELIYYIRRLNPVDVNSIINNRINIYEGNNNKIKFDIFYRPKNEDDYNKSLEFLYSDGFVWDKELPDDINFKDVKCIIVSLSDYILYNYDEELSDEFIIDDNMVSNDGNYSFANSFDELERQMNFIYKPSLYKHINIRKNIYENTKIIKYSDFENLEYRKGSKEYGGIITKLLEFLRMYNTQEELSFSISDFINKSNITMIEIEKLLQSKEKGQKLFDFDIEIDNNTITFKNLNKTGKNRPFESNSN